MRLLFLCFLLCCWRVWSETIPDKVLICGVCKNVERAVPNTIASATALGEHFADYQVIIYENNSQDRTPSLFKQWAQENAHVLFLSEQLDRETLERQLPMKKCTRTQLIARARNRVLEEVEKEKYADFKYVVWADLDFLEPWDVEHILDTIQHPEQPWDAVLANGSYDVFAFRDAHCPVGHELVGGLYWKKLDQIRPYLSFSPKDPWRPVYSAFGGLGIYKREAIIGCRYSGVVTRELERQVQKWLSCVRSIKEVPLLEDYERLLTSSPVVDCFVSRLFRRSHYRTCLGVRLHNAHGLGKIAWFSCEKKQTLPTVCEHIPFHAAMAERGYDRLFINPKLRSDHP